MPATDARKAFVGQPLRFETSTGVSTTAYPSAEEIEIETNLDVLANAQSLAASLTSLYAAGRNLYTVEAFKVQLKLKRGDTVTYKHPQFFPAGKDFIVWSITERVAGGELKTILTLYG